MPWYGKGYNGDDCKFHLPGEGPPSFWCCFCQVDHLWSHGCPKENKKETNMQFKVTWKDVEGIGPTPAHALNAMRRKARGRYVGDISIINKLIYKDVTFFKIEDGVETELEAIQIPERSYQEGLKKISEMRENKKGH